MSRTRRLNVVLTRSAHNRLNSDVRTLPSKYNFIQRTNTEEINKNIDLLIEIKRL